VKNLKRMGGENLFTYLGTAKTPEIRLYSDSQNKNLYILSIEGRCIPENPVDFFNPIIEKLIRRIHQTEKNSKIIIDLKLDYINSISVKFFIHILNEIKEKFNLENIVVNWYYEDDDSFVLGKDMEFMTELKFNFVKVDI
jgi:hypothetical protein